MQSLDSLIQNAQAALFILALFIALRIIFPKKSKKRTPSEIAHSDYKDIVNAIVSVRSIEYLETLRTRIDSFKENHSKAVDADTLYKELDDLYNHFYDNMIMDGSYSVG